jgi:hypothetical protein
MTDTLMIDLIAAIKAAIVDGAGELYPEPLRKRLEAAGVVFVRARDVKRVETKTIWQVWETDLDREETELIRELDSKREADQFVAERLKLLGYDDKRRYRYNVEEVAIPSA